MMSNILIVDDENNLARRVWPEKHSHGATHARDNSTHREVTSWRNFSAHAHERGPGDIVVLNLEASGAPSLQEAIKLRKMQPKLRFFYVVNVTRNLPKRTLTALSQPDIAWVSSEASNQEFQLRLQGLMEHQQSPWAHLMPELHNSESGRLDAARTAEWFGIPLKTLAGLLSRGYATVHKTPDAAAIQENLKVFLRIASALSHLAGSQDRAKIWLNTPNSDLEDNQTPISAIEMGEQEIIAEMLEDALVGQPG